LENLSKIENQLIPPVGFPKNGGKNSEYPGKFSLTNALSTLILETFLMH
jgi:hypothetical protein